MRLTHTRLLVDDFDEAMRFFREALRLEATLEVPNTYAEFGTGDSTLAIYRRDLMAGVVGDEAVGVRHGGVVVTMSVDSVDKTFTILAAKGVRFLTEPHDQDAWMLRVAHFVGPEGHLFEIYEPLPTETS